VFVKIYHNPDYSKIVVYFYKHLSVYISRVLLIVPISANFWTLMMFILTIVAGLFLGIGGYQNQIIGMVLLHSAFMMDVCDGEVVLYRKTFSKRGKFLDYLGHGAFPIIFFTLGLGISNTTGISIYLYMGIITMFFHAFCAHNRWAFISTVQKGGGTIEEIRKKDSFVRKVLRFATMGNFEFETGTLIFIMVLLKLDWVIILAFTVWLPLKWLIQTIIFYTDLIPIKNEKKIKQSF